MGTVRFFVKFHLIPVLAFGLGKTSFSGTGYKGPCNFLVKGKFLRNLIDLPQTCWVPSWEAPEPNVTFFSQKKILDTKVDRLLVLQETQI